MTLDRTGRGEEGSLRLAQRGRILAEAIRSEAARAGAAAAVRRCRSRRTAKSCGPARRSAARMMLPVQLLHALARDVRVDLRGREVAVPEQHLHHAQVGSVVEQVGRESMPQGVR